MHPFPFPSIWNTFLIIKFFLRHQWVLLLNMMFHRRCFYFWGNSSIMSCNIADVLQVTGFLLIRVRGYHLVKVSSTVRIRNGKRFPSSHTRSKKKKKTQHLINFSQRLRVLNGKRIPFLSRVNKQCVVIGLCGWFTV